MKITKRQLRRIIREEKTRLLVETRYASSHEEKAATKEVAAMAGNTIMELESLIDLNYHLFTDAENRILDQALELLQLKLGG